MRGFGANHTATLCIASLRGMPGSMRLQALGASSALPLITIWKVVAELPDSIPPHMEVCDGIPDIWTKCLPAVTASLTTSFVSPATPASS
ncbi:hypothetical protein B0H12DRAFT_1229747 [Mycena haematopus]|nr:hypothetical protein B0H12DRAFT_1229747 [Mycena haematopus]